MTLLPSSRWLPLAFLVAALAAVLLATVEGLRPAAHAQAVPASYYGRGLRVSARVEVVIGGRVCGSTTVDSKTEWAVFVAPSAPCGPVVGDTVSFRVDGVTAPETVRYVVGYVPPNIANGLTLSVGGAAPTPTPAANATPGGGSGETIGRIVSGGIPRQGGLGLFVFGGGSSSQLLEASGCPAGTATFWTTDDAGQFVIYLPGASIAALNEPWSGLFSGGIPAGRPLMGKCA